ncbi:MAG: hypothetical protein ACJ8CR_14420, partial [Roseiflexaceae bacterium]
MNPKQFVFNPPPSTMYPDYFYSSDPTIILKETHTTITIIKPDKKQKEKQKLGSRNKTQCNAINGRQARDDNELFGNDLSWAYRQYIVHTLLDSVEAGGQSSSPTDRPVQPVSSRSFQPVAKGSDTTRRPYLYLFNVIVALEWIPKPETLRRLEWAFRRASDFLYDVTNGCMAFGQVVFADVDWMDCADIQIMASNRFLPRSWVSGLLDPTKYTPIRVGRGVWVRNRQIEVPWDEPEGYRALVHEWGHYALGMKDEYISTIDVVDDNGIPIEPRTNIVVPLRRIVSESIMATIQGNSEFEPFCTKKYALNINSNTIENYYPGLKKQIKNPNPGPGRLPLPLPQFRYAGQIGDKTRQNERTVKLPFSRPGQLQNGIRSTTFIPRDKDGFPEEGWMVYLIRAGLDNPTRIIPQGEIDARAPKDGFRLLG